MDEKIDALRLPREVLDKKRRLAHRLRKRGMTRTGIGEIVGVRADTAGCWLKSDRDNLGVKRGGCKAGMCRSLSATQKKRIRSLQVDKTPDQLKMPRMLWTRKNAQELIEQEAGFVMPIRTVGEYLRQWGFTPQKPMKRAYEQSPKAVDRWLQTGYPTIKSRPKAEDAEIYWEEETGLRSDSPHERGYAPKGKTPMVRLKANRTSTNMISAVTNQRKVRFRLFDGSMNADILIDFCKLLIQSAGRKVFLVLDNLRVHHARVFKAWLVEHEEQLEVFHLPSYTPELNPDQYLNCDLKAGVHRGKPARRKAQLKIKLISLMRMLQRKPRRIAKYFEHKNLRYAAWKVLLIAGSI